MSAVSVPAHPQEPAAFVRRLWHDVVEPFEEVRALGPIARCTLPTLGTTHVVHRREDVRQVFALDGEAFALGPLMGPLAPFFGTRSLICLDGEEHLERRRLVLPAFHGAALPAIEAEVRALARATLPGWATDEPRPILPRTQALTFDLILRIAFGVADPDRARAAGEELRRHFVAGARGMTRDQRPVQGLTQGLLDERRASGHDRQDLLGMLLAARDEDGDGLDDPTLRDELLTALTAGHETTANGLAWGADALARHPDLVDALRAERAAGGQGLMDATVLEVLRLRPPLMGTSRLTTREVELAGHELAAGTHVTVSALLMHLDPDRYDEPHAFRPDRFTGGRRPSNADWLPFGGGRHRCAGAAFAQLELRVVFEELVELFDLEPAGPPPPVALSVTTHVPRGGAPLVLRRRSGL